MFTKESLKRVLADVYEYSACYESTSGTPGDVLLDEAVKVLVEEANKKWNSQEVLKKSFTEWWEHEGIRKVSKTITNEHILYNMKNIMENCWYNGAYIQRAFMSIDYESKYVQEYFNKR